MIGESQIALRQIREKVMQVTAALVKELRSRSGAAMMDCKNALVETNGDVDKAIDYLRKSGAAKDAKKATHSQC